MHQPERPAVMFGAAYYPEYLDQDRLDKDLDLMAEASFSVIRMGESTWSTWEPEDGQFNLDWLEPALDGALKRGIQVIVGTPTYAVPMWLARRYPEIAGQFEPGRAMRWGRRQEVDFSHAAFRYHAERIIRAVVGRYADHPAVIGYQVDNEPGLHLFANRGIFEAFRDRLRRQFGTVDRINREWGLAYWSHRLASWDDLWRPEGNGQPQYDIAWREFQARLTEEFIGWQVGIVRGLARPDQFVTTCLALDRPAIHEASLSRTVDVTAGNPYCATQDGLSWPPRHQDGRCWDGQDAAHLFWLADRLFAARGERFLVTETNAGSIGASADNRPPWPGQLRQIGWALAAKGAAMIEYWQWHTLRVGTETFWGGVLPHDQNPGRVYQEVARLGGELGIVNRAVGRLAPVAKIGLLVCVAAKWGVAFQPPFAPPGCAEVYPVHEGAYEALIAPWYQGALAAGVALRLVHDIDLVEDGKPLVTPAELVQRWPVLVAPALYVADDRLLSLLADYAAAGGHLAVGPRTGYADTMARPRRSPQPGGLAAPAGVTYQEFSNVEVAAVRDTGQGLELPPDAAGLAWVEYLRSEGATVLAQYDDRSLRQWVAVASREHGAGRVTTVGTSPNLALARSLFEWLDPSPGLWPDRPDSVVIHQAESEAGRLVTFAHNFSAADAVLRVPPAATDLLTGQPTGEYLRLGPWDVRLLV
ncbi:MAG: beta-galactosidase [Bifidobacteriaceae bacterium]|nr:beta-galactosidase [Bifidobacteriaceae bacterium]